MENIDRNLKKVVRKYRITSKEEMNLLLFLINNFSKNSSVILENLRANSPVRLAFEEFKLFVDD